jgi:hypothetical protein
MAHHEAVAGLGKPRGEQGAGAMPRKRYGCPPLAPVVVVSSALVALRAAAFSRASSAHFGALAAFGALAGVSRTMRL